jgi:hypothetical protein
MRVNRSGPNFPSLGSIFPLFARPVAHPFYHLIVGRLGGEWGVGSVECGVGRRGCGLSLPACCVMIIWTDSWIRFLFENIEGF